MKRWAGKRYIVLIEVTDVKEIHPFAIDRSQYGSMDDWLSVEKNRVGSFGPSALR